MEVRERIIDESAKLFFKFGIRNVTMDDIAVSLGISKRTVYEVFKDKTELIETCLRYLSEKQEERNHKVMADSANVVEAIITLMKDGIKAINVINPVFFYDIRKYYPKIWTTLYEENQKRNYNNIYRQLRKGINEGLFRKEIDVEIVTKLFQAQVNMLSDQTIFPPEQYRYADLFENLMVNFVRGISTQRGIELVDSMLD